MSETRVAAVGVSLGESCGVRDYAQLLTHALARERVSCSMHWLYRAEHSLGAARSEVGTWARALANELERDAPDAVLWHYSVFAYSYRGLPLFVAPALSALRARTPLIAVLHELAYPWRRGGWRGGLWALTQRGALIGVMRDCSAVLLTADFRAEWLDSRRWLPRRPLAVAPVFSNLPSPSREARPADDRQAIGLFGYAYEGAAIDLVLDALSVLRNQGVNVRLRLLGAPGRESQAAERWLAGARARQVTSALAFSGRLGGQELSNALAGCDILLFADGAGPSSRKGTLAGSLASGRPVVAIDGPHRWSELIDAAGAIVVSPRVEELVGALGALLDDENMREALGARGRRFAAQHMSAGRTAKAITGLLGQAGGFPSDSGPTLARLGSTR